ncbi:hypothetical protein AOQ84DRAFT_222165 [Glonium stellatum]|uniref:Uncharacterized protein n=1 Tax=Glonium stellatum TaxID=574774 RepID=A0A8E2F105_9PEZI|nr:hypothetical protein AOQ84DRAFT_222165 [Glonium stellatum]
MASRTQTEHSRPGDILLVVHEFLARSPDELSLTRGDRIELIERDDDFGDGWFLGKHLQNGNRGLFPEVYTRPAPRATLTTAMQQRSTAQPTPEPIATVHETPAVQPGIAISGTPPPSFVGPLDESTTVEPSSPEPAIQSLPATPLQLTTPSTLNNRSSLPLTAATRTLSMTLGGALPGDQGSPVMNETLSVIEEHITDMHTPRHSIVLKDLRSNDSGSEYSNHLDHRLSYINGQETDDEEETLHTEEEVMAWTPARVAEYLEDIGVERRHCDIFREQEISGEVLLGMDQATIFLKEFELGPVGPRLRTWLKIKALQQEVKTARDGVKAFASYDVEEANNDANRNRSTSMGAVLPRIPSLMESSGSRTPPIRPTQARASTQIGQSPGLIMEATSPLVNVTPSPGPISSAGPASPVNPASPTRPSAASVRSLNQNRRHSSIDFSVNPPTPNSAGQVQTPPPTQTSHKKQPSFDRNWTMGSSSKPRDLMRPSSSAHTHSLSTDGTAFDTSTRELGMTVVSPIELDRGYFSGGEVDNRKARNVLRKKDSHSPTHSRAPSYSTEATRRAAYKRQSRIGSTDSTGAESISPVSPAAKVYYGTSPKGHRTSSAFEFVRPLKSANDLSPTVTKLEYGISPSIDAIASSPNLPGSETSSLGRASPAPVVQSHSYFAKKYRATGLRAISDAITGSEKAFISSHGSDAAPSPIKESPVHSPTRTGSSTPSGTSKSFDLENSEMTKHSTGSSSNVTPTSSTARRKSKKKNDTSAYRLGRQQISPRDAMVGCDYSGWMKKKSSNLMTTWKTRLFVLRGRRLSYFYTEYDTEEKGLIDISSHRVLPANNERITGLHATLTRAASSPSSPQNAQIPTTASADAATALAIEGDTSGMFIFKLVPPRSGLQKGVQFTKPIVHYFAVDNIQQGRLWMAALMKATIDRDETSEVVSTYQQKTISLAKARAMRQRPPALMGDDEEKRSEDEKSKKSKKSKEGSLKEAAENDDEKGLAISGLDDAKALLEYAENGEKAAKSTTSLGESAKKEIAT